MSSTSIPHPALNIKGARFVPANPPTDKQTQYKLDYQIGHNLYRRDHRMAECANDAQRDGYKDAMDAGADAYYASMARDGAYKAVNWNSGSEGWA